MNSITYTKNWMEQEFYSHKNCKSKFFNSSFMERRKKREMDVEIDDMEVTQEQIEEVPKTQVNEEIQRVVMFPNVSSAMKKNTLKVERYQFKQ